MNPLLQQLYLRTREADLDDREHLLREAVCPTTPIRHFLSRLSDSIKPPSGRS